MKRTSYSGLASLILLVALPFSTLAQTARYPTIDWSGTIFDEYEHAIGWISKQGIVQTAVDDRVAVIDKAGNAFDGRGQRIGKMQGNATFVNAHGAVLFKLSEPKDNICELIDPSGKIIGFVHNQFRNQAIAIQCVYAHAKSH